MKSKNNKVYEVAVYGEQCVMSGRVCYDPESEYGENWRDNHDLCVYVGTKAELRELFDGATGWLAKAGRAVLEYIA